MQSTLETESPPMTAADQLRACADWLDGHPCPHCLSVTVGGGRSRPTIHLSPPDLRRHFSGAVARKTVAQYCTTYVIERDGFEFQASEYETRTQAAVQSEVRL